MEACLLDAVKLANRWGWFRLYEFNAETTASAYRLLAPTLA